MPGRQLFSWTSAVRKRYKQNYVYKVPFGSSRYKWTLAFDNDSKKHKNKHRANFPILHCLRNKRKKKSDKRTRSAVQVHVPVERFM